ncbi:MAG: hypothetical protein QF637_10375 [Acidimicrobiales bacterium]|nr:hypothetical protein [Acidimicrobiales bacterium]
MKIFSICVAFVAAIVFSTSCSDSNPEHEFCEAVAELQQIDALSLEVLPSDDLAVRGALTQTSAQATRVAREAPLEIRGDAEVIAAFLSALTYAIDTTEFDDDLQRSAAIGTAQQEFEGRLSESVANLNSYVARTCSPAPN